MGLALGTSGERLAMRVLGSFLVGDGKWFWCCGISSMGNALLVLSVEKNT